jgi:hypothetical protein
MRCSEAPMLIGGLPLIILRDIASKSADFAQAYGKGIRLLQITDADWGVAKR